MSYASEYIQAIENWYAADGVGVSNIIPSSYAPGWKILGDTDTVFYDLPDLKKWLTWFSDLNGSFDTLTSLYNYMMVSAGLSNGLDMSTKRKANFKSFLRSIKDLKSYRLGHDFYEFLFRLIQFTIYGDGTICTKPPSARRKFVEDLFDSNTFVNFINPFLSYPYNPNDNFFTYYLADSKLSHRRIMGRRFQTVSQVAHDLIGGKGSILFILCDNPPRVLEIDMTKLDSASILDDMVVGVHTLDSLDSARSMSYIYVDTDCSDYWWMYKRKILIQENNSRYIKIFNNDFTEGIINGSSTITLPDSNYKLIKGETDQENTFFLYRDPPAGGTVDYGKFYTATLDSNNVAITSWLQTVDKPNNGYIADNLRTFRHCSNGYYTSYEKTLISDDGYVATNLPNYGSDDAISIYYDYSGNNIKSVLSPKIYSEAHLLRTGKMLGPFPRHSFEWGNTDALCACREYIENISDPISSYDPLDIPWNNYPDKWWGVKKVFSVIGNMLDDIAPIGLADSHSVFATCDLFDFFRQEGNYNNTFTYSSPMPLILTSSTLGLVDKYSPFFKATHYQGGDDSAIYKEIHIINGPSKYDRIKMIPVLETDDDWWHLHPNARLIYTGGSSCTNFGYPLNYFCSRYEWIPNAPWPHQLGNPSWRWDPEAYPYEDIKIYEYTTVGWNFGGSSGIYMPYVFDYPLYTGDGVTYDIAWDLGCNPCPFWRDECDFMTGADYYSGSYVGSKQRNLKWGYDYMQTARAFRPGGWISEDKTYVEASDYYRQIGKITYPGQADIWEVGGIILAEYHHPTEFAVPPIAYSGRLANDSARSIAMYNEYVQPVINGLPSMISKSPWPWDEEDHEDFLREYGESVILLPLNWESYAIHENRSGESANFAGTKLPLDSSTYKVNLGIYADDAVDMIWGWPVRWIS